MLCGDIIVEIQNVFLLPPHIITQAKKLLVVEGFGGFCANETDKHSTPIGLVF